MTATARSANLVAITSSDDIYGADRISSQVINVLQRIDGLRISVWVPSDSSKRNSSRLKEIEGKTVAKRALDLPIVRRRNLSVKGMLNLLVSSTRTFIELRRERPQIVYLATSACLILAPLARLAGVKHVVLHVQEIWSGREAKLMAVLAKPATDIICISAASAESLPTSLAERAFVIPNAVPAAASIAPRERGVRPLKFIVASRWNAWKGHTTLFRAWDLQNGDSKLVVLGGPPELGTGIDVVDMVSRMKNSASVEVIGEVADISPYLADADFVIVPSDQPEPFGLVAIEAMSHGLPVIASDAGGLKDIVVHGKTGWLYKIRDANDLARCIEVASASAYQKISADVLSSFYERYAIERFDQEILTLFDGLTETSPVIRFSSDRGRESNWKR